MISVRKIRFFLLGIVAVGLIVPSAYAFSSTKRNLRVSTESSGRLDRQSNSLFNIFTASRWEPHSFQKSLRFIPHTPATIYESSSTSCLYMYNLPPSGGGGGGNDVGEVVRGAVTIALIVAFFVSPLGGLILGLFNSFLVLLFVLPLIASVGFQIWQSLNTISGACPNCGAPVTVLKTNNDGLSSPSLCFNCGAVLQANYDNTGIDNISGRTSLDDLSIPSPMGGGNSIFDVFTTERATTTTTTKTVSNTGGKEKRRRETTIIDVDVEDLDETPFQ
jgi:hypothetical protein